MRLSTAQRTILAAMQAGDRLKVHRAVDGDKSYRLHRLDDNHAWAVASTAVDGLARAGLIESNMKFPAATFLLTDKGRTVAASITGRVTAATGPRNFT